MAGWNGSGTFSRTHDWTDDQGNGIKIRADRHDDNDVDFVSGINNTITKDGQNSATSNLPMGGNKHTGVADAVNADEYVAAGQLQEGALVFGTTTGSANTYVLTPTPAITAYVAGMTFNTKINVTNTGASTINISGEGAKSIVLSPAVALSGGELLTDAVYQLTYDGTNFQAVAQPGSGVNAQTDTTYTYLTGDNGMLVTHSNAASIAGTLPQANSTTFANGWKTTVSNLGAGTLTITPTTSTINGAATLVLETDESVTIESDGTDYQTSGLSAGSGSLVLLQTQTASSDASIAFSSTFLTTTHKMYIIELIDIVPATDAALLEALVSEDNGSTYKTGATDYGRLGLTVTSGAVVSGASVTSENSLVLTQNIGNDTGEGLAGTLVMYNPLGTALFKKFTFKHVEDANGGELFYFDSTYRYKGTVNAVNNIQFAFDSGNIASGIFKLYGVL